MKKIIPIYWLLLITSCNSSSVESDGKTMNTSEESLDDTFSDKDKAEVAVKFVNSYIENSNKLNAGMEMVEWAKQSPLVTEKFKNELASIVTEAYKIDPGMGLDFDPIIDAQDYPEEGVKLAENATESGYYILQGINWDTFKVSVKVVAQNGKLLVDGCGIVNISKDKRADK